ncbi:MAG: SEL1-like repeat protein [Phenylobacterium sp.]|nr:SEL1-like repeat protein [Phenylobacterium sp.]
MTSGAPWSVKGIDPKAREVAKDLARRSGMTLGEWLNRMILDDDGPEEITSQTYFERNERPEQTYFETPRVAEAPRIVEPPRAAPDPPGRYEAVQHPADEIGRVAIALDRLSGKIERSEPRMTPEASAADTVVREAMARIEAAERENIAVAARFEGAVQEARAESSRLAERLRRVEAEAAGPRSAEALRSLEAALGKVANHLYEGEGRTRETIKAMEQRIEQIRAQDGGDTASLIEEVVNRVDARLTDAETRTSDALASLGNAFAGLGGRVDTVEKGGSAELDKRLGDLAATLSQRVDTVRGEIAQKLQAAADGRFDRMERKLGEMAETARKAELTSGEAIEKMGREVLTMADTLNRRVQAAEHRSADAIEQVGGEVARIAQAMESRLGRSEGAHAEALEKLGAEIGKITERLTERIGSSERRAAQAIDDVGEQVARVSERISQRQERSSEDLVERIRQSEERTARLLDEAREKIDRSLAESQRRLTEQALAAAPSPRLVRDEPPPSPFGIDPFRDLGPAEPSSDPLALQAFAAPEADAATVVAQEAGTPFAEELAASVAAVFPTATEAVVFDAEDFEAADGFAPIAPEAEVEPEPELAAEPETIVAETAPPEPEPEVFQAPEATAAELDAAAAYDPPLRHMELDEPKAEEAEPARPLTTREVIEQARAAARAASSGGGEAKKAKPKVEKLQKPAATSLFSNFGLRPKRTAGGSLQTALLVAGGAAFLSLGAASYFVADSEAGGAPPQRVADALAVVASDKAGEIKTGEADTTPLAAIALAPQPMGTVRPPVANAETAELATLYSDAVAAIKANTPGGLESLRKAANLGHSPAQFYLAKLYETGEGGLKKDPVEARRWTERAAQGGNRAGMHNLGIALIEGKGGSKNSTLAAQWFRRAADLGLVDSQYNLGALYERGLGVSQNAAEAYKWYLIAARTGDDEARKSAARVRADLSPEARSVSERAAQGFRATAPNPSAGGIETAVAPVASIVTAQRLLSQLGYYQGPRDGVASPALTMAIAAYQREQGLEASGTLDQMTVSRLQVFTR